MEKITFNASLKNVPKPSRFVYEKKLISQGEIFLKKMRWKLLAFKQPELFANQYETHGFGTRNSPPGSKELEPFEQDFIDLISDLSYRPVRNEFQKELKRQVNDIKASGKILVSADKTRNQYRVPVEDYKEKVTDALKTVYEKQRTRQKVEEVNEEAYNIAKTFPVGQDSTLADRIDVIRENECFVTFKDHKPDFPGRISTRLINPSRSSIGRISKHILDGINQSLKVKTKLNLIKSSQEAIDWFNGIQNKQCYTFFKMDLEAYYPSISEALLIKAVDWARKFTHISDKDLQIILHSRKSFIFFNKEPWTKKKNPNFDCGIGSSDSCEASELVGFFLLDGLKALVRRESQILFRDDWLGVVQLTGPQVDRLRKNLIGFFAQFDLKITVQANVKRTDYLDILFDLESGLHRPFRKDDNVPCYINVQSNHPPHIIRNLPEMISKRVSMLSSNQQVFEQEAQIYNEGLKVAGYKEKIKFIPPVPNQRKGNRRKRNVIWFNPPFHEDVSTPIGEKFLKLIRKHFKKGTELGKLFNSSNVKMSYGCTGNMSSIIAAHNSKLLSADLQAQNPPKKQPVCKCGGACSLDGRCVDTDLVYSSQLTLTQSGEVKEYLGSTSQQVKSRISQHTTDSKYERYKNRTNLAKMKWSLRDKDIHFTQTWKIECYARSYTPEVGHCDLCATEKYLIVKNFRNRNLVNDRSEIISTCRHRRKFLLNRYGPKKSAS